MLLDLCLELLAFRVALSRLVSQCFHAKDTFQEGGGDFAPKMDFFSEGEADLIKG